MKNYRFDAHVHVWENEEINYPCDPLFGSLPDIPATPALLNDVLNENGITYAALIQPGNYGFDASMVADVVAERPDRYVGLGMVDPSRKDVTQKLEYWIEKRNLVGMRVLGSMLQDVYFDALWEKAHELGAVLSLLTGPMDLSPFQKKLLELPPTSVIFDHFAHRKFDDPEHYQQLLMLSKFPNTFVKISGFYALSKKPHPHSDAFEFIKRIYDSFGPERMMWASDFPYILDTCGYSNCLELCLSELPFILENEIDWICGKTAYHVFMEREKNEN